MWFFKGFAQGVSGFIVTLLVMMTVVFVVAAPIFVCEAAFGQYGAPIGAVFEMVMAFGLLGAWHAYTCRSDE